MGQACSLSALSALLVRPFNTAKVSCVGGGRNKDRISPDTSSDIIWRKRPPLCAIADANCIGGLIPPNAAIAELKGDTTALAAELPGIEKSLVKSIDQSRVPTIRTWLSEWKDAASTEA